MFYVPLLEINGYVCLIYLFIFVNKDTSETYDFFTGPQNILFVNKAAVVGRHSMRNGL